MIGRVENNKGLIGKVGEQLTTIPAKRGSFAPWILKIGLILFLAHLAFFTGYFFGFVDEVSELTRLQSQQSPQQNTFSRPLAQQP